MAQAAISSLEPTVHLGGYPDYRGVAVVGAAQWLPALDVGLVVKQDADEALAALRYARRTIVTLGLATVALLAATGFVFARSRRQADASERRQRSILDNTSAAVALKDRDGAYLVANEAWLRVLQRPGVPGSRPPGRGRAAVRGRLAAAGARAAGARGRPARRGDRGLDGRGLGAGTS